MGKEQDVLQAAQSGNVSKLESLIQSKPSKNAFPFASLKRGPNINWRDESGYTALHLAALNGHKEAVKFLLYNDASANIPDNAGSFPLHLAAFNGHHEVAKILFDQGPSKAEVNEPNMAGDTALHVAAQYGHRYVVQVLVEHHAELALRNNKDETPLDLAAQYGHLSTVQLLLFCKRSLVQTTTQKHGPLHLAARNGHQKVIELLLDSGMDVNTLCDMGSALHCAALFGKVPVARLLLERGIDIKLVNSDGETVLDVLCKHPSQRSQEITALIFEQSDLMQNAKENEPQSPGLDVGTGSVSSRMSLKPTQRVLPAGYDAVPPPRPAMGAVNQDLRPYALLQPPGLKQSFPAGFSGNRNSTKSENFDLASVTPPHNADGSFAFPSSSTSPYGTHRSYTGNIGKGYSLVGGIVQGVPSTERSSSENFVNVRASSVGSVPIKQKRTSKRSESEMDPNDVYVGLVNSGSSAQNMPDLYQNPPPFLSNPIASDTAASEQPTDSPFSNSSPTANVYSIPPTRKEVDLASGSASFPPLSPVTTVQSTASDVFRCPTTDLIETADEVALPGAMPSNTTDLLRFDDNDWSFKMRSQSLPASPSYVEQASYSNVDINRKGTGTSPRPDTANPNVDESNLSRVVTADASTDQPARPNQESYYQDPPCIVFRDKLEATKGYSAALPPDSVEEEQRQVIKSQHVKQKRTTMIRSDNDSNANVLGTHMDSSAGAQTKAESPHSSPGVERRTLVKYSEIQTTRVKQKRTTYHGPDDRKSDYTVVASMYEPRKEDLNVSKGYRMSKLPVDRTLNEQYEWNKIDSFLSSLEEFAASPTSPSADVSAGVVQTENVTVWLASLRMDQFEPAFISHGFDEIEFLGHSLEDQDLIELGVLYCPDRQKLIKAANELPPAPVMGDESFPVPQTVMEWLTRIKLLSYAQRFIQYGYDNIDRVRVIWEIELATVLDINILGHRKRMMNSLGRRPVPIINAKPWSERFAEANKPLKHTRSVDDTMAIAHDLLRQAENLSIDRQIPGIDQVDTGLEKPKTSTVHTPVQTSPISPATAAAVPAPVSKASTEAETPANARPVQRAPEDAECFTNWKHHPDSLLYSCVSYPTQYLGSHPVQNVRGVISTLEACSKMKAISRTVRKMPIIELSISVRGIDYVDANSKMVISSYEIQNISFCAQDPADLQVFAYITRDVQTQKNYCHVFKAASVDLADEVITTIGQSFHLAYEQHVKLVQLQQKNLAKSEPELAAPGSNLTRPSVSGGLPSTATQSNGRTPPPKPAPYGGNKVDV